jgi:UDP-glucose 4-epimerase
LEAELIGIYGATGFIGRHVVRHLLSVGSTIRVVSRRIPAHMHQDLEGCRDVREIDLKDRFHIADSLEGVDIAIQMISSSSPGFGNAHIIEDIHDNILPHVAFVEECVRNGVRRLIFLSSGGTVYGHPISVPIAETHPTEPINSHGLTKLVVEKYLRLYEAMSSLECVVLRLANPYGPGQMLRKGQGLIPALLTCLRNQQPVRIFGDGSAERDYVYIDDVCEAIACAVTVPDLRGITLNIGSGEGRSVTDIVGAIETILGRSVDRISVPARPADVQRNVLDITLARERLGWEPRVSFSHGLRRTLRSEGWTDA